MLYIYTHIYLDFLAFNEFWANFHKFWTFFHKDVTGWSLVTFFNTSKKTPHVFSLLDPENSEKNGAGRFSCSKTRESEKKGLKLPLKMKMRFQYYVINCNNYLYVIYVIYIYIYMLYVLDSGTNIMGRIFSPWVNHHSQGCSWVRFFEASKSASEVKAGKTPSENLMLKYLGFDDFWRCDQWTPFLRFSV